MIARMPVTNVRKKLLDVVVSDEGSSDSTVSCCCMDAPALTALTGDEIDSSGRPNAIRASVRSEMAGIEIVWEFRVQLCRDLGKQPVEEP